MIASDYIKDIKKAVDIFEKTVYFASIYRMKCDKNNIPEKVSSIFGTAESLKDKDGTGFFVNSTKTCEKDADFRTVILNNLHKVPTIACFFENCLKFDKIKCNKNVKAENCVSNNQWIGGFSKYSNGTFNVFSVECCEYKDAFNPIFSEYITFNTTNFTTNYVAKEFGMPFFVPLVNNITITDEKNGMTIYSAFVYHVLCNEGHGLIYVLQEHQERSLKTMISDMIQRASESALLSSTTTTPITAELVNDDPIVSANPVYYYDDEDKEYGVFVGVKD